MVQLLIEALGEKPNREEAKLLLFGLCTDTGFFRHLEKHCPRVFAAVARQSIENVKASIQTLGQLKTDYEQQRRHWLLSFYDSSVELLYENFRVNFGDFPSEWGQSLNCEIMFDN